MEKEPVNVHYELDGDVVFTYASNFVPTVGDSIIFQTNLFPDHILSPEFVEKFASLRDREFRVEKRIVWHDVRDWNFEFTPVAKNEPLKLFPPSRGMRFI